MPKSRTRIRNRAYGLAGIVMGAVWVMGSDTTAWEHALRVLALVVCAGAAMALLQRRRARLGRPADHRLHSGLLLGKVLLVAAALIVDGLLGLWIPEPSPITAALLCVAIAVGGPALHRRLSRDGNEHPQPRQPGSRDVLVLSRAEAGAGVGVGGE
ncbi:hypothetical protein OG974_06335 [Streptomyces sp. NBC_00597]|uniref:hypothetical protein n=1 Tax=Streptomyces sp. NBC_00597 TaxID=2975786 RepID=UPI0030DF8503